MRSHLEILAYTKIYLRIRVDPFDGAKHRLSRRGGKLRSGSTLTPSARARVEGKPWPLGRVVEGLTWTRPGLSLALLRHVLIRRKYFSIKWKLIPKRGKLIPI